LAKTGKSVGRQLKTALGKLAKADGDDSSDRQANDIASELNLNLMQGLTATAPWIEDVASDRAQDELLSLGIASDTDFFDHANTRAADYAADRSAEMVSQIDESTRNMLRSKIAEGLASGAMRNDIIADIMDGDIFSEARATLIADHEVAMASGAGAQTGRDEAVKAGVKLKKIWVCDDDPCPICVDNQDAGAIDNDDEFPSGDMTEVAHVNCECHTESIVEDDEKGDDDDEE